MKFTVSEIFCELVSSIGFIIAFFPVAMYANLVTLNKVTMWIASITATQLALVIFVAYLLGVLLNIIGLPADRLMRYIGISGQYPGESSSKLFFEKASSHLLNYRTNNWNHYYCFRNLFIFSTFGLALWAPIIFCENGWIAGVIFVVTMVLFGGLLYLAVNEHADFYSEITKTFDVNGS